MRFPSGTRICLLAVFGFLMLTSEFPEFSRFMPKSSGAADGSNMMDADGNAYFVQDTAPQSRILVAAQWGYGGYGGYGGWGRRGWGGYGGYGGWGRRGWGGYGGYGGYGGWGGGWRRRGWGWG